MNWNSTEYAAITLARDEWWLSCLFSQVTSFKRMVYRHFGSRTLRTQDTLDLGHFWPRTLQHQRRSVRKTLPHYSAEVSGHFRTTLWKIVLHLRISELLLLMWLNAITVDVWSWLNSSCETCFFWSPSVCAVACRLFEVNRDSTVRMCLMISTQPLPLDHCALQLLIVITSDWSLPPT